VRVDEREGPSEAKKSSYRLLLLLACGKSRRAYHFTALSADEPEDLIVRLQEQVLVDDALGSRTWGAAPLLANRLLRKHLSSETERCRGSCGESGEEMKGTLRVLELGAGTGLVGLAMARSIRRSGISAQVYLTDYHADVLANLRDNVALNGWNDADVNRLVDVQVCPLDWRNAGLTSGLDAPFDVLVAAGELVSRGRSSMV
jgi:SAM-dependent methyltransferase